ncbi:hypothetical protein KR054_004152 [Drosophila jambulina]|nr:hypothetical protein KR054_004152 [Drosophila jambulina]
MPSSAIRPVSTYDNLGVAQQRQQQQQQQSELELEPEPNGSGTSHSIAAVKAALNDAKSKFFGINNYESPAAAAAASASTSAQKPTAKSEPMYQNLLQHDPQRDKHPVVKAAPAPAIAPAPAAAVGDEAPLQYVTTYEQIPLSDLDAPQPSQAVYMSTTVPQNMKGMKIAGRHTPTRNSLRHSRMIVVNHKNHDSKLHIRNLNISRQLLIMQLAVGLLITGLAVWILILAPNASILINPYLSGLSLLLASIAGLILHRRNTKSEQRRPGNSCYKVLLAESYVFSALTLVFCCLALVCAAIEFAELTSSPSGEGACGPATSSLLSYQNCTCFSEGGDDATPAAVLALEDASAQNDGDGCGAIRVQWKYLLAFSMALNTLGIVATFLYITLFICCRSNNRKHFYTSV